LEKKADTCVNRLNDCLTKKPQYVTQEAIIVFRDIFRRYPKKYEKIIAPLMPKNINDYDDPEARASIIWIIGEYCDIFNADQLIMQCLKNFDEESYEVQ